MIDTDGRKQPKREHVDEPGHKLHPGYSPARCSSKPIIGGHRMSYHHEAGSSRPGEFPSIGACRQFVDHCSESGAAAGVVKQQRTSSDTCRQMTSSTGGDMADELTSCGPAPPGVVTISPQCQYLGAHCGSLQPPQLPPPSYSDQLYYAARGGPGSAMATGSGPAAGLYNPYDPVVAAGLHRLQQAGHMMGSPPCALSAAAASPLSGGYAAGEGYYAGLMAAGGVRTAGGSPYVAGGGASAGQYHCSGVPYAGSAHHQMSSLMNLAGSAAAAACITPPSPQPPPRMQPFVSNSSL